MALEIIGCVPTGNDDYVGALAYNRFHKELFIVPQGEKHIHVRERKLRRSSMDDSAIPRRGAFCLVDGCDVCVGTKAALRG